MSLAEFIDMGGHGIYVWPAYTITFIVLLLNIVFARVRMRDLKRDLKNQQRLMNTQGKSTNSKLVASNESKT
ncbi:MAG: hypothetical protein BMS9Abin26_0467 [Gammaproteobacteria bacterium]|nr:MAG: hypothetical protein BMS9Abin26_0467 [Gammaproteobacteria bacterium]